jgi:hypothetical protein
MLRNYDAQTASNLTVTVRDLDGTTLVEDRYHIKPLETEIIELQLPQSGYEITAELGSKDSDSAFCRISETPTDISNIETGNGIVNVVNGL